MHKWHPVYSAHVPHQMLHLGSNPGHKVTKKGPVTRRHGQFGDADFYLKVVVSRLKKGCRFSFWIGPHR